MKPPSYYYLDPLLTPALAVNGLDQLDALWEREIDWFEEPNQKRGGWSGVGRLVLDDGSGQPWVLFVKRQQHYGRRSWRHPWSGEPTFRREFQRLQELAAAKVQAPHVVAYAEWLQAGEQRAMLVTESLTGFVDLETLLPQFLQWSRSQKVQLLRQIAEQVRRLHQLGLMHRALYPKHIFVHANTDASAMKFDIAFIDLEKARHNFCASCRMIIDLSSLYRRLSRLSHAHSLLFFEHYLGTAKLSPFARWCLKRLVRRSRREGRA